MSDNSIKVLLESIDDIKKPEIYLKYKKVEFSIDDKQLVVEDFLKRIVETNQPSLFLNEYFKLSILKEVFPELYKLTLTIHDPVFHPEKDISGLNTVWGHSLIALDISAKLAKDFKLNKNEKLALLLGTLFHDIGKPLVTKREFKRERMVVSSPFHDSKGVKICAQVLKRIGVKNSEDFPLKTIILNLVKNHHRVYELYKNRNVINKNVFGRLKRDMLGYENILIYLDFADRRSREPNPLNFLGLDKISDWILNGLKKQLEIESKPRPFILGRDVLKLGYKEGKTVGLIVDEFYKMQLNGKFQDREAAIEMLKTKIKKVLK